MPFGSGTEAKVPVRPDLAVIGFVKSLAPFKKSETSVLYSGELELAASTPGGRDAAYYMSIVPEFFTEDFDKGLDALAAAPPKTPQSSLHWGYRTNVWATRKIKEKGKEDRKIQIAALPLLAGTEGYAGIAAFSNKFKVATPPTLDAVHAEISKAIIRKDAKGNHVPIGYVLQQDKDEDDELLDRYKVAYFFTADAEGLTQLTKSRDSKRRKKPLVFTWEKK